MRQPCASGRRSAAILADKNLCQRQIEAADAELDALVYEVYSQTEEEIAIVEEPS